MKRFIGLCVILMLTGANLIAQDVPIKISTSTRYLLNDPKYAGLGLHTYIDIVSLSDKIIINKIDVNKGHCRLRIVKGSKFVNTKKNLSYGKKISVMLSPSCNLLRVDVFTNQGDWSVEY